MDKEEIPNNLFNIFIITAIILITISLLLYISYFFNKKEEQKYYMGDKLEFPIIDNYILILTRENCPYCDKLDEIIKMNEKNIKHNLIIIKLKLDGTYDFDNNYTTLKIQERNKINNIVHQYLGTENILFPTLFKNYEIQKGLPMGEKFNIFFEIKN